MQSIVALFSATLQKPQFPSRSDRCTSGMVDTKSRNCTLIKTAPNATINQNETGQSWVIISMYLPDNLALNLNKILYANNRHLASFSRGTGLCVFSTIRNDNHVHVGVVFFSHAMSSHERIHFNVRLSTNTCPLLQQST